MKSQGRIGGQIEPLSPQSSHIFSLSSIEPHAHQKFDVEVDFKSCSMEAQSAGDKHVHSQSNLSTFPVFNQDGNTMSPAFVLQHEKCQFEFIDKLGNEQFFPRTEKNIPESQHFMMVKPRSQYCSVCKSHFPDYLNHIRRQDHLEKLRWHNRKIKIEDLVSYFNKTKKRERKERKQRRKSSFHETESVQKQKRVKIELDENEVIDDGIFSPESIIKRNMNEMATNNSSLQKQSYNKFNSERILQY